MREHAIRAGLLAPGFLSTLRAFPSRDAEQWLKAVRIS